MNTSTNALELFIRDGVTIHIFFVCLFLVSALFLSYYLILFFIFCKQKGRGAAYGDEVIYDI